MPSTIRHILVVAVVVTALITLGSSSAAANGQCFIDIDRPGDMAVINPGQLEGDCSDGGGGDGGKFEPRSIGDFGVSS